MTPLASSVLAYLHHVPGGDAHTIAHDMGEGPRDVQEALDALWHGGHVTKNADWYKIKRKDGR